MFCLVSSELSDCAAKFGLDASNLPDCRVWRSGGSEIGNHGPSDSTVRSCCVQLKKKTLVSLILLLISPIQPVNHYIARLVMANSGQRVSAMKTEPAEASVAARRSVSPWPTQAHKDFIQFFPCSVRILDDELNYSLTNGLSREIRRGLIVPYRLFFFGVYP